MVKKKPVHIPYTYRGQRNSRERTEKEEGGRTDEQRKEAERKCV